MFLLGALSIFKFQIVLRMKKYMSKYVSCWVTNYERKEV